MPDDGGKGFHVHPVFQGCGHEQVAQIVKADFPTPRVFQDGLEAFSDRGRVERRVLLCRGGEHPAGIGVLVVFLQHTHQSRWQNDGTQGGFCFGRGYNQFPISPINLALDAQFPGVEVQIIPLEGQHLALAQARGKLQQK